MDFIIMGKAKDVFRLLRQALLVDLLTNWEPYETDPDWWQVRIIAGSWRN